MSLGPVFVLSLDSASAGASSVAWIAPSLSADGASLAGDGAPLGVDGAPPAVDGASLAVNSASLGGDAFRGLDFTELDAEAAEELAASVGGGRVAPPTLTATTPATATRPPTRRLGMNAQRARPMTAAVTPTNSADRPSINSAPENPPPISPNKISRIAAVKPANCTARRF